MYFQIHTCLQAKFWTRINLTGVFLVLSFNAKVDSFEMFSDLGLKGVGIVTLVALNFCFWMLASVVIVHVTLYGGCVATFVTFNYITIYLMHVLCVHVQVKLFGCFVAALVTF